MKSLILKLVAAGVAAVGFGANALAGEIASAVANRGAGGTIESITLDVRVGANETVSVFRLSGLTAGEEGSTNGWDAVDCIGVCATSQRLTCEVPAGWGETAKQMSFILSDAPAYEVYESLKTPASGTTPYISTGVIPTDKTRIHIKFNAPKDTCVFGLAGRFGFFTNDDKNIWPVFQNLPGGTSQTGRPSIVNRDVELTFGSGAYDNGDGTFSVGDTMVIGGQTDSRKLGEQADVQNLGGITTPLPLFRRLNYNTTAASKIAMGATIYYAQIFEDDEMIRDFVPVKVNGVAMMYDRCTREPYPNVNPTAVAFTLGAATGEFICDEVHVIDGTRAFGSDAEPVETGAIKSATANRDGSGKIQSVTLSLAVPAGQTNFLYCAYGATAGAVDSTNGWAVTMFVGGYSGDASVRVAAPAGWEESVKAMRFFLSDGVGGEFLPVCASLSSTSSGNQYVSTGFIPTDKTRLEINYYMPAYGSGGTCAFGITDVFYCFGGSDAQTHMAFQNKVLTGYTGGFPTAAKNMHLAFGHEAYVGTDGTRAAGARAVYAYDGSVKSYKLGETDEIVTQKNTAPLTLFARITRNDTTVGKYGVCTIYAAQIYENNMLVRDYVPVVRDGVAGLFDRCANEMAASSGTLVAGEPTGEVLATVIHVVSASDAFLCEEGLRLTVRAPVNSSGVEVTAVCEPASATGLYEEGTTVRVTPVLGGGWEGTFHHWEGDVPAGHEFDNSLTVTMDRALTLIPIFDTSCWKLSADRKSIYDGYWSVGVVELYSGTQTLNIGGAANPNVSKFLNLAKPVMDGSTEWHVTHVTASGFADNATLCELRLWEGHTGFGGYAFQNCTSLTNVVPLLPASVKTIYSYAFYHCSALTGDLRLGADGTACEIYNHTFCAVPFTSLTCGPNVSFSDVNFDSHWAFSGCAFTNVVLSAAMTQLPGGAFARCNNLTRIDLPETTVRLGPQAIAYCDNLETVTMGENMVKIGDRALGNNPKLTTLSPLKFDNLETLDHVGLANNPLLTGKIALGCGDVICTLGGGTALGSVGAALYGSGFDEIELGANARFFRLPKSIAPEGMNFGGMPNLTKVTIWMDHPEIPYGTFINDTALRDLIFASMPEPWTNGVTATSTSWWSGWTDGQVRVHLPKGEEATAFCSDSANVTRWADLDEGVKATYDARFGATAKRPYGKTVSKPALAYPSNQWILLWNPRPTGTMILVW